MVLVSFVFDNPFDSFAEENFLLQVRILVRFTARTQRRETTVVQFAISDIESEEEIKHVYE